MDGESVSRRLGADETVRPVPHPQATRDFVLRLAEYADGSHCVQRHRLGGMQVDSTFNQWGVILHGSHVIRSWSRMQNFVAMSSAEAELYGTVRASCELLGIRSLARDVGRWVSGRLYADASAALGIIHR